MAWHLCLEQLKEPFSREPFPRAPGGWETPVHFALRLAEEKQLMQFRSAVCLSRGLCARETRAGIASLPL